mgnify:CR=1 FL=1
MFKFYNTILGVKENVTKVILGKVRTTNFIDFDDSLYKEEYKKLLEEKNISTNRKIKFNSIKDEEIKRLTKDIKNTLFVVNKDIQLSRYNFKDSINRLNNYLENLSKETKSKKPDLSYTQNKEIYIENYILNSIVNYAIRKQKDCFTR